MRTLSWQQVCRILERQGFVLRRQRGSHLRYRGIVNGEEKNVTVPRHRTVKPGTLGDIVNQSGLPKDLFE
ncbi:MAG: type II toxin-antitoxin system HicA family toxin [Chloroflexi bacterium]|nr:type II toxin-antitoxin system HicA family toxin [Chloroflexota bacterium]MCY3697251.1 type II toxin-antitoxin system HicA family toxin [Chloroflexota bacterium]MXX31659.1 addiction module toxin, HicA family [Chloroflexota bacterium]MYB21166.1 addiction module toxin, HicA family [Chloroflexota bacterium]MYD17797.1 addiction module toxin, HicA family [Chloroflexota bacterium]